MNVLQEEENGVFWVEGGADIKDAIAEAIALSANQGNRLIRFKFRFDVIVSVYSDSSPELIFRDWWRADGGYIDKNVGPYPNPILTDQERKSDARIEIENRSIEGRRRRIKVADEQRERDIAESKRHGSTTNIPAN